MESISPANTMQLSAMLPFSAFSRDAFMVSGSTYSKEHINSEIEYIINNAQNIDENLQPHHIYLHGSNSASLQALGPDGRGLLPASRLNKLGKEINSGETTNLNFRGQYGSNGHDVVFTSKFEGDIDSDIATYMSYNTQEGNRYPVLYIISDANHEATEENYRNHTFDTIPPNKIIGLLVPEASVDETSMRIREHFPHIQVNSLGNPGGAGQ